MAVVLQLIALSMLCMTWISDDCEAQPSTSANALKGILPRSWTTPSGNYDTISAAQLAAANPRGRLLDLPKQFEGGRRKHRRNTSAVSPGDAMHMNASGENIPSYYDWHRSTIGKPAGFFPNNIIEKATGDSNRNRLWLITFVVDTYNNSVETTIYRYEKPDIEMSFTKRLNRKFVEELADDLAMVTAIIFMVECDLKNMPPHSIAAMRDMFAGMLAKSMDLTFHLKGRGSFRKLPLDALHIERAFIDVFDVNGFQGDISFSEWFNKDAVRISKLTSYGMHWQYLANYQKLQLDRLHIVANDDNEYLDVLCQLIVMPLKQFRVRLVDGNKVLAEWEKTSIYQRDGDKYVHELLVRIWTIDEAELLASFLYVHKPNDFIDIDINMKVERLMFVDVYDELRKSLEPFNKYRVQDYKKQRNGRTDAVNVIEVIDRKFFGRLVSDFVTLPSGERFTSIELEFDDLVELEPADVDWMVDWLADCRKAERLEIIDHDMDLLSKTVELVLFDKVSEEEKYPDAFDKLIEVKSTIVGSYWVRFLFDWPACERLRFYMKTKNTYSGIKAKAENVRWKDDRCNDTEQLDSFTCAKFRRNNNKRISFGHRSAVRLTAT